MQTCLVLCKLCNNRKLILNQEPLDLWQQPKVLTAQMLSLIEMLAVGINSTSSAAYPSYRISFQKFTPQTLDAAL